MATKSYSKHKEFKEYSTSGTVPYTDEQFDMLKTELIPKGSKLNSLGRNGTGAGTREYHYEYKEEKHPSGKYDRKDLHTVEEFTIPAQKVPKATEASSYYYEREDRQLPAINSSTGTRTYNYETSTSSTPGYSKVKSSKVTKDLSQNVDELDSLLDDLQKDQERQLYKSGYTSDTAESSSFDYKRGTVGKAPSSGYSTLKREELASTWGSVPTTEVRQELYREEKTESRVVPAVSPIPAPMCECHHTLSNTGTLSRSSTPMNKVTTTVKTYTYEVPAGQDPATLPLPAAPDHQHTYLSSTDNLRTTSSTTLQPPPAGCQYCTHCNSHVRQYRHVTAADEHSSERIVYPSPVNDPKPLPTDHHGHPPYGPSSYKISETSYSSHNSSQRFPPAPPSPSPFPRPTTPSPGPQQPPKRLDDLLADFPEARFPTQPDGIVRRKIEVTHENSTARSGPAPALTPVAPVAPAPTPARAAGGSKNVAGPAVYYPPGHTPFAKKEGAAYQASAMQGGGAYASGRGMYEYESGSRSKEKHSERKTAVPICLPLCCAMPCVIM